MRRLCVPLNVAAGRRICQLSQLRRDGECLRPATAFVAPKRGVPRALVTM